MQNVTKDVLNLKDPDNSGVHLTKTSTPGGGTILTYYIGPLSLVLNYVPPDALAMQIFLILPIVDPILVGEASGSLKEGISTTIGYKDILSGTISVKRVEGGQTILHYNFVAIRKSYDGDIVLPI